MIGRIADLFRSKREDHAGALGVQSILHNARVEDVIEDPFPHLVIQEALDPALYERLASEFPSDDILTMGKNPGNNKKHFFGARAALTDDRISPLWRNFFEYHVSGHFYREVVRLFDRQIRRLYPDLPARLKKDLKRLRTGVRRADLSAEAFTDCQFAINSPVSENSSTVRGPHLDGPDTLYQCMLYFRDERDTAGGDLELYRFKEGADLSAVGPKAIDPALVSRVKTVAYEKNTMIVFLNSPRSLHGVSYRSVTPFTRRYVGILCDFPMKIFPRRLTN